MKKIIHAVHIHASPQKVFQAVASETGLSNWWSTKVRADSRKGGIVDFTFVGDFHPDMKITALEAPQRLAWRCIAGHEPWQDNTFDFVLDERDGETLLLFTQEYARELDDERYGTYNFNWGYYINSLKSYCETGKGQPYQA